MYKKIRAVMLITNSKMLFACGTVILNILEFLPEFDNILVFHDNLLPEEKRGLARLDERIQLIEYSIDDFFSEFNIDKEKYLKSNIYKRYTHLNTSKIRMFNFLKDYKQIIFFDSDILLKDNLQELLNQTNYDIIWK